MLKENTEYNYADGFAVYIITYNGYRFVGEAVCHPDDIDFESERVGLTIAEARANIKVLRHMRDCEVKPQLKILNHLLSNMKTSKSYNPISYEAKMLRSQIRTIEKELATISNAIADEQKFIKDYIDGKDKMYKRLRAKSQ
jgi:predicted  nucleic acid-binding Zn-ribbon protein